MSRSVRRMSYPDAAMKLAEADAKVARCMRELERALVEQDQAQAEAMHALWLKLNGEEPPQ